MPFSRTILAPLLLLLAALQSLTLSAADVAITTKTTPYKYPGKFVWMDMISKDPAASARFYAEVFDWKITRSGQNYFMASHRGQPIAGFVQNRDEKAKRNHWVAFASVTDPDGTHQHLVDSGANSVMAPTPIDDRGVIAVYTSPEGEIFGTIDAAAGDPEEIGADLGEWLWLELWSTDPAASSAFYQRLGYTVEDNWRSEDPADVYLVSGGYTRAGIVNAHANQVRSAWLPYIRVASIEESLLRVSRAGGRHLPLEGEASDEIALVAGPAGSVVALYEWDYEAPSSDAAEETTP